MNFYQELSNLYFNEINPPSTYMDLAKIGNKIAWYMADSQNNIVNAVGNNTNYLIDIDITSAFPNLCRCLYPNTQFVDDINNNTNKKAKNILIATTLKGEQLKQLNRMCKMIIMGIVFDSVNEEEKSQIDIFELKKDGILLSANKQTVDRLTNLQYNENTFTKFIIDNGFTFHVDNYAKYIRCNRTSFLLGTQLNIKNFIIKGQYKHVPVKLLEIMFNILLKNEYDETLINRIYSHKYFKILKYNNLQKQLTNYYTVENKILNYEGRYTRFNFKTIVNPELYKKMFIYPMILSNVSF